MESLIETTTQEKENILKLYNVTETEIKRDVEIIKTWKEKQPHLPQNIPDDFIANLLLKNKFRVEKTKEKLDNYYSFRGQIIDLIPGFENIVPSKQTIIQLPMPKLTPNLERIIIFKFLNSNPDDFDVVDVLKLNFCMEELCLHYNYCYSIRFMCDCSGISVKHLSRINLVSVWKINALFHKAFSKRVVGVEFINFPSFASKIVTIMKMVMGPKLYKRLTIHDNIASLYEKIPKEYLPLEYGGSLGSLPDLLKKWDKVMEEIRGYLVESSKNISAEHLRPAESKCHESFGVEGTFKKLEID